MPGAEPKPAGGPGTGAGAAGARPQRLVLVDNDSAVLDLLLLDLRLEGHEVLATASNGEEALQVCAEYQPEVLVVDLRLGPGIDGLEVARRINAGAATSPGGGDERSGERGDGGLTAGGRSGGDLTAGGRSGGGRARPRVVLYTNYITPAIVGAAEAAGATVVEKGSLGALRRAIAG